MEVGLVGSPGSGKTTLFNALTGSAVSGWDDKAHVGVADIPDPRLGVIARHIPTKKLVPATLRVVDIPGVPAGSEPKKLSAVLEQIRQVDAIVQVVRCFDDGSGTPDAAGELSRMADELVLADLVVADSAKDRAARTARTGETEAKERLAVLERVAAGLEEGTPVRAIEAWSEADRRVLRAYGFITAKTVLYVANVDEDDPTGQGPAAAAVAARAEAEGSRAVAVCAKLEAELAELAAEERQEMLEGLGLEEPAVGPLARAAHAVLGLTTFYTAGEKEVRAWTIPLGASAPEAAGVIHSDIQRGFIRAECYGIADLEAHRSEKAIKEAGKMRSEGKGYAVRDGDVIHFLFNV